MDKENNNTMYEIEKIKNKIIQGDSLTELKKFPDESIDMVITSPPYYALRNYGVDGQIGLEPTFEEYLEKILAITAEIKRVLKKSGSFWFNLGDMYGGIKEGKTDQKVSDYIKESQKDLKKNLPKMKKCLLMMPERIALAMIDQQGWILRNKIKWAKQVFIKQENRTKGSVMPTSTKDRFNESGEELYFFVKNKDYYADLDAVRLPNQVMGVTDLRPAGILRQRLYPESKYNKFNYRKKDWKQEEIEGYKMGSVDSHRAALRGGLKNLAKRMKDTKNKVNDPRGNHEGEPGSWRDFKDNPDNNYLIGKNLPTIWLIGTEPHNFQKELNVNADHFAIFPQALLEIPIKFGCPQQVCKKCGKPIIKIIKTNNPDGITGRRGKPMMTKGIVDLSEERNRIEKGHNSSVFYSGKIVGYSSCNCNVGFEPGIVLDPFMGAATTAIVAKKLGRNYIGIELNPAYIKIAEERIKKEFPENLFNDEN